jgi:OPA family glycerol-3-phosphate transporter-like MFS transporter/OPA family sugar phosphate sensor protein UhpC-like MFS transporter
MTVLDHLRTQPDAPHQITDPAQIDQRYRYWRFRILTTSIIGYALFYFVRANIAVPLKVMGDDLHYSKEKLGLILTIGGVTYGVSKFINGFIGDHANPRYFMAIGLAICAVMNVFFGFSSSLILLCSFWFLNQYAQGMGFPPCAKSMAYWFAPKERNTTFGVWHTSHMIGGALIQLLTAGLVIWLGWRSCFYVPAGFAMIGVVIILLYLRDTPGSLGLPPVEIYKGEETPEQLAKELKEPVHTAAPAADGRTLDYETPPAEPATYWQVVNEYIFKNPYMWIISVANLLVYTMRYIQMNWGPTFLQEAKGLNIMASGGLGFGSEMAGMVSALIGGYIADRYFRGRAGRVCVIAMALMTGVIGLFWMTPKGSPWIATVLFISMGFLLYVPQMLIASMAMTLGTKRASAAAVGLTGIFGYASTVVSGVGVGYIVDHSGWGGAFALMLACAVGTLLLMALTWNVGAHPELEEANAEEPASAGSGSVR